AWLLYPNASSRGVGQFSALGDAAMHEIVETELGEHLFGPLFAQVECAGELRRRELTARGFGQILGRGELCLAPRPLALFGKAPAATQCDERRDQGQTGDGQGKG